MSDRKATDILLDIESSIKRIEGFYKNIDLTNKLIIERNDKILKLLEGRVLPTTAPSAPPRPPSMPTVESFPPPQVRPPKATVTAPDVGPGVKVPVQQKIVYPDGKNVLLAVIEIFNDAGILAKKTRTNSAGKWNASLLPGKYSLTVMKSASDPKKPSVERHVTFDVPESEFPVELDPLQV